MRDEALFVVVYHLKKSDSRPLPSCELTYWSRHVGDASISSSAITAANAVTALVNDIGVNGFGVNGMRGGGKLGGMFVPPSQAQTTYQEYANGINNASGMYMHNQHVFL